ncbi:MAG: VWA domain-containing protein [Gammaproteobacteria bacterium]|nr:VWA domain-containing protein [Gammaproteobacteria bacterium]
MMDTFLSGWSLFHFIRPFWLWACLPLLVISVFLWRRRLLSRSWETVIDPNLLPHLLIGKTDTRSHWPVIIFFIIGVLIITALAGPAWKQLPQPVYKPQSALVIVLDLSRSMDAGDIKPTRLERARFKISDILKQRHEGQTALIAYAADAFTVSPLTDDAKTIDSLVPSLNTYLMPAQGSRVDKALLKAKELFTNAGIQSGHILLITDGVESEYKEAFRKTTNAGYHISILAIGSEQGAPINQPEGGFLKDKKGQIVIPRLDSTGLQTLAKLSAGRFSRLSANDSDIKHILDGIDIERDSSEAEQTEIKADVWQEEGPWLLIILLPFIALIFRRGILLVVFAVGLNLPQPAKALETNQLWQQLWQNDNQRAAQKLQQDQAGEAAKLFNDSEWKAAAHYKAGEYEQALEQLQTIDNAEAHYNRGNTLAKLGQLDEALKAYEQALKKDPQHEDAKYNKELIEKQKQQQKNNNQDQDSKQDQDQKPGDSSDQNQQQKSDQDNSDKNDSEQESDRSQSSESENTQQQNQNDSENEPEQDPESADQKKSEHKQDQQEAKQDENTEAAPEKENTQEQSEQQQASSIEPSEQELSQQATEKWLRRIPDDPGGLLRRKFKYQYQQQPHNDEKQPW